MKKERIGFLAGSFDVIHPGYIYMFEEAKQNCDKLIVGLHTDPTIERKEKLKPILSVDERKKILLSLKFIDDIFIYDTESELLYFLENNKIDIRFLGDDYENRVFTGSHLIIPKYFINRRHGWSTTKFKKLISESYNFTKPFI